MKCQRAGCDQLAQFYPVLLLWAHPNHPPAEGALRLPLCRKCAVMVQEDPEELLTDEGWSELVQVFSGTGKLVPKRELTKVRLDEIA